MALLAPALLLTGAAAAPGSLDALLAEAWANNPAVSFASAAVASAEGALAIDQVWLENPELEASGFSDFLFQNQGEAGFDVAIVQRLAWPGGRQARVDAAEQTLHATRLRLALARLAVAADVERAASARAAAQETLRIREDIAESARTLAEAAKKRVEAGAAGQLEATLAAVEAALAHAATRAASAEVEAAEGGLCVAIGRDDCRSSVADASAAPMWPALSPLPSSSLLEKRVDVRASNADVAAAWREVDAARALRVPSARLGVGYAFDQSVQDAPFLPEDIVDPDHFVGVTLSVTLPVWDWRSGEVAQARARAARAEAERRAVGLRAEALVAGAFARFRAASDAEARLATLDPDVGVALADVERAYVEGGLSLEKALTTRDRLQRTRLELAAARRAKVDAHAAVLESLADPTVLGIEVTP
jgi:cobalt-zinc-cadmium efflux system outer membrane protein